jgi:hypothetical protein
VLTAVRTSEPTWITRFILLQVVDLVWGIYIYFILNVQKQFSALFLICSYIYLRFTITSPLQIFRIVLYKFLFRLSLMYVLFNPPVILHVTLRSILLSLYNKHNTNIHSPGWIFFVLFKFFSSFMSLYVPCYRPYTTNTIQTSMPPVGFEPTIPVSKRPKTHALDRAATGIGDSNPRS